jgi:hypothetical protein
MLKIFNLNFIICYRLCIMKSGNKTNITIETNPSSILHKIIPKNPFLTLNFAYLPPRIFLDSEKTSKRHNKLNITALANLTNN